jgi:lysophospholipase L1-like esterase
MKFLLGLTLASIFILAFRQKPPQKIVFFGDSITQAAVGKTGYITRIDSINKSKKGRNYELIGAGISGNRVEDLYKRLDRDVLSKNPDAVVIWIGVNDVWHKKFVTDSNKQQFSHYYSALLTKLQERNIRAIICTPGVIGEKKAGANDMDPAINECADSIRAIARRFHCPLVDLRKQFLSYIHHYNSSNQKSGILTSDGVHLNPTGNLFVAEQMYKIIRKKIK